MSKLLIFGNKQAAEIAYYYFSTDSEYEVVGFVVDEPYIEKNHLQGLPVLSTEKAFAKFTPQEYDFFVAIGYSKMSTTREKTFLRLKTLGYRLATYISSKCTWLSTYTPGENCFILENNTIQPFVKIGSNITLWSGNHIGHHSFIDDHCFLSSHVVVSGNVIIGHHSFLGVNSTITDGIQVAPFTLVGAGATITKNTREKSVYVPQKSMALNKNSIDLL